MAEFALAALAAAENFTVRTSAYVDTGSNLNRHARRIPNHSIEALIKSTKLTDRERRKWVRFAAKHGRHTPFDVVLPIYSTPTGTAIGTPTLAAAASAGDDSIEVEGFMPNQPLVLGDGDLLRLPSHIKVYLIDEDITADAQGKATIPIDPPLMSAEPAGAAVTVRDVPVTVYGNSDVTETEIKASDGRYSIMELEVVEAL